jgi:hypothetical protein
LTKTGINGKIFLRDVRRPVMREMVNQAVIEVLTEILNQAGQTSLELNNSICPMVDLPGFDSINSVEVSAMLTGRFNHDIPSEVILRTIDGQPVSIELITNRICEILS